MNTQPQGRGRRNGIPRLILNDDGTCFLLSWDDLGAEDLRAYLSRLKGTHVDMVAFCVAFGGWLTQYESTVGEPLGTGFGLTGQVQEKRLLHNRERLKREVGDYVAFVFSTLAELGIAPVASIRMNDAHMSSARTGTNAGRFWMNHPEWRLGEPYGYYANCLDYAVPAVREMVRRLVHEIVGRYPRIAGVELDGLRSPFLFKEGAGQEHAPLLTELIRQIREDLDEAARAHLRSRYLLRVNVPRNPELSLRLGMDVAAWDVAGLVDGVSPGCHGTDFQLPIQDWKALLTNGTQVHAYINCGRVGSQYHSLEEYRGAAANAYASGSDGLYLFNFACLDELSSLLPRPVGLPPFPVPDFHAMNWHPDLARTRTALAELGDPGELTGKDKKFLYHTEPPLYHHEVPEQAVIERLDARPVDVRFRCYEDMSEVAEARLEFKLTGVSIQDRFTLSLNGKPLEGSRVEQLYAPGGRDGRIRPTPLQPYFLYRVNGRHELVAGENCLTIRLSQKDPDLMGRIEVREVELFVSYS